MTEKGKTKGAGKRTQQDGSNQVQWRLQNEKWGNVEEGRKNTDEITMPAVKEK